jgi:hypothetical protein
MNQDGDKHTRAISEDPVAVTIEARVFRTGILSLFVEVFDALWLGLMSHPRGTFNGGAGLDAWWGLSAHVMWAPL